MKKVMSVLVLGGAVVLGACDGNADAKKCTSETAAQNGDTVVIDFAGYLNGEQFAGGTANGYALQLGSGQFIPGFEEQLVCTEKGESRDVNVTFPSDYMAAELAGQDVVFKVTVVDIIKAPVAEEVVEAAEVVETPAEPAADAAVAE